MNQMLTANIVDIENRRIYPAQIQILDGRIHSIEESNTPATQYAMPGFIDAHVHIESSMLVPSEFARLAVIHGTVATVSDPHEIANVMGIEGVHYMIENGQQVPFHFFFGAPSCVPATTFETAGAVIDAQGIQKLLARPDIKYLAEMMNYPGVLFGDEEVYKKINIAKSLGKVIDGHAPGIMGDDAQKYIDAGISTDHECFTLEEALDKLKRGMKILIREGSAAKNFAALITLLPRYPDRMMFCSDDKHPDDLIKGHINQLVARAIYMGCDLFDTLKVACINPILHYKLEVGQLKVGDSADFIIVNNLTDFKVISTYIKGQLVAELGQSKIESVPVKIINTFNTAPVQATDFQIKANSKKVNAIHAIDGEIVTQQFQGEILIDDQGNASGNTQEDILKIAVINRYQKQSPQIAFIKGFRLKDGAIASCVAHDSHNIIVVGTDDQSMAQATNLIIEHKGGVSAVSKNESQVLPLPVAGIMSNDDGKIVAKKYAAIDSFVKTELGSPLSAPFMTLSFMALLVIPELKLSDLGLFDGKAFQFTNKFM